jgi:phosphatidylglycerol:prolipoprotein diacylglycerol transferase
LHPVLISIGDFNLYSWGFMLAVSVILAIFGIGRLLEREGFDREIVLDLAILTVISGIVGGRLAYMLIYEWPELISNPLSLFYLTDGGISGLVWYGGLLGGFLAFVIYLMVKRISFWPIADMFSPFVALGYCLVRVGCFLNGCCYGKPTASIFGVVFPFGEAVTRHPTQLYSSLAGLLIFLFLMWFLPKRKFNGQVFILFLILYSVYRFFLEFLRENAAMYGPFSTSQSYSVFLFAAAVVLYLWRKSRTI